MQNTVDDLSARVYNRWMYEFPPTAWEVHGLMPGPLTELHVVAVIAVVALGYRQYQSSFSIAVWALLCVCCLLSTRMTGELPQPQPPLNIICRFVLAGVCAAVAWRTHKTMRKTRKDPSSWVGIFLSCGLLLFCTISAALPATYTPWEVNYRRICKDNLKQLGLAMHKYHDEFASFPLCTSGSPAVSWRVTLLPYLDETETYQQYDAQQTWDSESNQLTACEVVDAYRCPTRPNRSQQNASGQFLTSYSVPVGVDAIFSTRRATAIRDITDGTSNTLMVMEACGSKIVWTDPRDLNIDVAAKSVNQPTEVLDQSESILSSYHHGGAQVLLADGSVRFIGESIDPATLRALLTKNGGETVGEF